MGTRTALTMILLMAAAGAILDVRHSQAQPAPIRRPETFDSYDVGAVGRIDLRAWQEHDWKAALARYDADGDGRISAPEFIDGLCGDPRCHYGANLEFRSLDRNHNGLLDRKEMDAMSANLFRANDLNHDGFVTREEMEQLANRH